MVAVYLHAPRPGGLYGKSQVLGESLSPQEARGFWSRPMVEFPLVAHEKESLVEQFTPTFCEARPWNPE